MQGTVGFLALPSLEDHSQVRRAAPQARIIGSLAGTIPDI
jgi:hypothetical protein